MLPRALTALLGDIALHSMPLFKSISSQRDIESAVSSMSLIEHYNLSQICQPCLVYGTFRPVHNIVQRTDLVGRTCKLERNHTSTHSLIPAEHLTVSFSLNLPAPATYHETLTPPLFSLRHRLSHNIRDYPYSRPTSRHPRQRRFTSHSHHLRNSNTLSHRHPACIQRQIPLVNNHTQSVRTHRKP